MGHAGNRWYLPLPSQNGRAAFEKRFSRFDADDGGGPLDLSAVGRWRLDIRRIDGDEEFTFFIDDLVALPSRFRETPTHWIGRTDDLIGSVGRTNGLLEELQTVSGRPMTILPRTPRGLEVTIKNVTRNWSSVPGGVSHYKTSAGWGEDGRYQRIVCQYVLDEKFNDTLELKGQYTFLDERLDIQFAVKYLKDSPDHHEIMVGQQYVPLHWESEIYTPSLEFMTRDPVPAPVGEILLQYADTYDSFYDFREAKSWVKSYNYGGRAPFVDLPLGVLQNNDTFFLWCYRDLGRHVNLAPRRHGRIPSFLISPSSLKAGGGYRFDFSYKSFSRPLHTYRDVFRWYAENVTSTHPASAGLVTRPKDLPQRTIHHGNLSTMGMYNYGALGHSWSDLEDIRNGRALNLRMTNAWGAYWIMDEVYRTTGIFRPYQSHDTTPEELRKYFLKMKKKGFKIYLYYRQLLVDTYPDKIPFSRWKLVGRDGRAMQYAHGPVDATKRSHQFADFTNPEFRDWYIDRVKQSIVYFDPDAVAWDMGWGDIYTRYAACDPPREGNGIHHGILRVQAEVYQWLKANFPEKKVTINLSGGTPSALYADGVMFEGGNVPRRDSEAYKAYGIDVINLTYSDHYKNGSPDVHIQSIMRAFSRGATWATTTGELYEHPDPEDVSGHTRGLGLYLNNMEVLADYSALANSLPLLTETHVVITSHVDMPVSAWADAEHLLVAVFNDTQRPGEFSLELNREILRKHGFSGSPPMRALHFNSHGLPDTLDISLLQTITPENNLQWTGKFGPGELVLIVKDLPENHRLPDHLFLSSEKYEFVENPKCEPGEQVEVKVEVVDTFDRRIAQANDYTVTITGAGQEKRVSGKTDEQGIATMTVTLPHEGTVKLEASSGSLAARQSHRGLSLTFKQATSKLIDGFVKVKQLKKTGAVNHVTQTSLEVKEGKVAAKLELDPMLSLHGSVKKRLSAPLDLSKYSNGGFIGWWMYRDGPGSLESVTLIVGQRELATFQGPFSSGWQYYKTNVLLPGSLSDYRFDFAGLQGEKFSLLIDDLRVHQ